MKKLNSLELKDKQSVLIKRCKEIVDTCKKEVREMTDDEEKEFNTNKDTIAELKQQLADLEKKLASYDEEIPSEGEIETKSADEDGETIDEPSEDEEVEEEDKEIKKDDESVKSTRKMKKQSIVKEIRTAMKNGTKQFKINANTEKRAASVSGGIPVEDEFQGILEPLYANSVLSQLGVKWYKGMPMGNVVVPVMGKGNVGWSDELAAASSSDNAINTITLQPKRLTAYVDISKMLIAQDTYGVEEAIRRDIVNALNDKLEATILGDAVKSDTQPAGIFNGVTLEDGSTFAKICENEAKVEENNVYGDMKYLLSTGAKADLRAMAKSTKNTQLVYEGGEVDGVPAITTSNVKTAGAYVYGDFSNLAVGSWGNIDVTVDEYSQAINGCVRLVINAYFDAKVLRPEAFVFGKTRA